MRQQKLTLTYKDYHIDIPVKVTSSKDSFILGKAVWESDMDLIERFYAVFLNTGNNPVSWALISMGGIAGTVADVRIIMGHAILSACSGMIIFHNHPSGVLIPSKADMEITQRIKAACEIHSIKLLDHLIISENDFYSFADEGNL